MKKILPCVLGLLGAVAGVFAFAWLFGYVAAATALKGTVAVTYIWLLAGCIVFLQILAVTAAFTAGKARREK